MVFFTSSSVTSGFRHPLRRCWAKTQCAARGKAIPLRRFAAMRLCARRHFNREGAPMPERVRFSNPKALAPPPGYSYVVESTGPGRTIYFAGQLGIDTENKFVGAPGDFRAQAVQTFENLKAALAAVGADFSHVVKLTNLMGDIKHLPIFREVRDQYLSAPPPASTTVQIAAFAREGALLEVEAVAVLPA